MKKEKSTQIIEIHNWINTIPSIKKENISLFSFVYDHFHNPFLSFCYIYSSWLPYRSRASLYCFLCYTLSIVWADFLWFPNGSCHVTEIVTVFSNASIMFLLYMIYQISLWPPQDDFCICAFQILYYPCF